MNRALPLALALLMTAVAGCRAPAPQVDRDADEVRVSLDEADRAFLYSAVGPQGLLRLRRGPADGGEPARLYAYRQDTRELVEVSDSDLAASGPDGQALISVSVQEHAACLNLWDWIAGDVERLDLRLDGLSARPAEPPSAGGQAFDLVFTAREGALFPLCPERDFELFSARIAVDAQGAAVLLGVRQLTHNRWDDAQPAFSPDGHWIVYVSDDGGPTNVALMDSRGNRVRTLTSASQGSASLPVVLPNNEECLYVLERGGVRGFRICGLDGRGDRQASAQELKDMLFSWDDGTRHKYLLTDVFAGEQELRMALGLPATLDLQDLVLVAEWNSPLLKQYRQKILAARAEGRHNRQARGARAGIAARHMVDTGVLVDEPDLSPGDRSMQGFTRLLFTLSFPLFPGSLNKAIRQRDEWQEAVYSQTYLKRYNELVYNIALEHTTYSEQTARAALLRKLLDLHRKRRFIWQARVAAGRELPAKPVEADGYIQETEADLTTALGKARAARGRLCALLGVNDMDSLRIQPAPMDWEQPPVAVPPLEEFQGLAQLNHPDLARLKFLELRAAAIRDMGAPETRERPTLDVAYGYGTEHFFSEVVDDFISVGLAHSLPLGRLDANSSYREQWTHEMLAYREERQQARLTVNADLQETWAALERTVDHLTATKGWRDQAAEALRLARIYAGHRAPSEPKAPDIVDEIQAAVALLRQKMVVVEVRAEFCRHIAQYYYRAGLARRLLDALAESPRGARTQRRAVWLWRSLEVATDPLKRDELLRVCAEAGVNRIYCFVSRGEQDLYLRSAAWEFGYLLDLCRERGIEVYALVGNAHWLDESYHSEIGALLRSIVEFNSRTQQGRAGFAGVKLDVEPHALPEWRDPDGRNRLVQGYLDMLDRIRALLAQDGAGLALSADVPPTYADVEAVGTGGSLFEALCERLDELTVMAYLSDPEAVVRTTLPLMAAAQEWGVALEVGVETAPNAEPATRLAVRSAEELLVALDRVYGRLAGCESFAGFAIHDYRGLVGLMERNDGNQVPAH